MFIIALHGKEALNLQRETELRVPGNYNKAAIPRTSASALFIVIGALARAHVGKYIYTLYTSRVYIRTY